MHRLTPGPFPGSLPGPDTQDAAFNGFADLVLSGLCIVAAAGVWLGAPIRGSAIDIVLTTKISSGILLVTTIAAIVLMQRVADMPRLAVSRVFGIVTNRLTVGGQGQSNTRTPANRSWPRGLAGVVESVIWRIRGRQSGYDLADPAASDFNAALQDSRYQARQVAAALNREADFLAMTSVELEKAGSSLATDIESADGACANAQGAMSRVIDHVVELTGAVCATTAEAQRATEIGVGLSDLAFNSHRIVAALDDRTSTLLLAADEVERLIQRVGALGQAAGIEADRIGVTGQPFAPIAAGIQELASDALSAIRSMHQTVAEMGSQAASAVRDVQEIGNRVHRLHDLGLAMVTAVAQHGEEMSQILQAIDEAQAGFITIRASVEAANRHGATRLAKTDLLRESADRLPSHAEAIATILRSIPDFTPPVDFGF